MAHWGISYAAGPNYNLPWHLYDPAGQGAGARRCVRRHAGGAGRGRPRHAGRAGPDPGPAGPLSAARADRGPVATGTRPSPTRCARCSRDFRDDLDVGCAFAEAIMNETPWKMWDLSTGGAAEGAGTKEAVELLERPVRDHPGVVGSSRPAASLCPSDGDVAVPAAGAEGRRPAARPGARCRAIWSTCRPISTCCAATIATSSSITRRRSRSIASTWRAKGR